MEDDQEQRVSSGSDKIDAENTRLWRIYRTMMEMLSDRVCAATLDQEAY
jgi:hypothetical protein